MAFPVHDPRLRDAVEDLGRGLAAELNDNEAVGVALVAELRTLNATLKGLYKVARLGLLPDRSKVLRIEPTAEELRNHMGDKDLVKNTVFVEELQSPTVTETRRLNWWIDDVEQTPIVVDKTVEEFHDLEAPFASRFKAILTNIDGLGVEVAGDPYEAIVGHFHKPEKSTGMRLVATSEDLAADPDLLPPVEPPTDPPVDPPAPPEEPPAEPPADPAPPEEPPVEEPPVEEPPVEEPPVEEPPVEEPPVEEPPVEEPPVEEPPVEEPPAPPEEPPAPPEEPPVTPEEPPVLPDEPGEIPPAEPTEPPAEAPPATPDEPTEPPAEEPPVA